MADLTLAEFTARTEKLGAGGLLRTLRPSAVKAGLHGEGRVKLYATTRMRRRTGNLAGSVASDVQVKTGELEIGLQAGGRRGSASQPVRYARIQEKGDTVRPKRGRFLAIPIGPALTAAGVPRFHSPRDVPDLVFVQSLRGQPLLVKQGTGEPWFLLRRKVTIKPKHYLRDGARDAAKVLPSLLSAAVVREVTHGSA